MKSILFQPLSFIEFEADYRPNATLYRIKEAKSFYPFSSIPYDPYKSSMALFLSEFLYRAVREEAENRPLFAYLQHSIIWLDECGGGFANFHLVFLMRLSRFLGLYPNLEDYHTGDYFDLLKSGKIRNSEGAYDVMVSNKGYKKPAQALQDMGFSSDPNYASKLIAIIEENDLTTYDK